MSFNLITILGPTAAGKTSLAAELAYIFNGEIISADSRQVYSHMDIGTGKDLEAYSVNQTRIPYHLIDIAQPEDEFNLFLYLKHFYKVFNEVAQKGRIPFLTGGTGLYLHAVLKGYSLKEVPEWKERYSILEKMSEEDLRRMLIKLRPSQHNTTDLSDKDRIIRAIITAEAALTEQNLADAFSPGEFDKTFSSKEISSLVLGVYLDRETIKKRITLRLKERLQNGMIEEVERLVQNGISYEKLDFFGLEYRYIALYLKGSLNYNDMYQKLNSAIHSFAKRQMTWFRKMEREGIDIHWINGPDVKGAEKIIRELYFKEKIQ